MTTAAPGRFGDCCEDMADALGFEDGKTLTTNAEGVLYLTVAAVETDDGPGFYDIAVSFCPFCGVQLQSDAEVAAKPEALN